MLLGPVAQAQVLTGEGGHVLTKFIFHRIKDHLARPSHSQKRETKVKNATKLLAHFKQGWH